jgi:hypothetical protein
MSDDSVLPRAEIDELLVDLARELPALYKSTETFLRGVEERAAAIIAVTAPEDQQYVLEHLKALIARVVTGESVRTH